MKKLIAITAILCTVGCASQPSTYEDMSTSDQRNIKATGAAATEAARSNRSTNVNSNIPISLTNEQRQQGSHLTGYNGYIIYDANGKRDYRAEIIMNQYKRNNSRSSYTTRTFKREFNYKMQRKIDKTVDKIMDKIF